MSSEIKETAFIVAIFQSKWRKVGSTWDAYEELTQVKVWATSASDAIKKGKEACRKEGYKIKITNAYPL